MQYRIYFVDGNFKGRIAEIILPQGHRFEVGMLLKYGDETYRIMDGAAAQAFEKKQEGHTNLAASCQLVKDKK